MDEDKPVFCHKRDFKPFLVISAGQVFFLTNIES